MNYNPEVTRLVNLLAKAQQEQSAATKAERDAAQLVKDLEKKETQALSALIVELRRNGIECPIVLPVTEQEGKVVFVDHGGGQATVLPMLASRG